MKQHQQLRRLTAAALLAAFTAVATLVIQIPTPTKGYLNLGDCFVNLAAWLLGGAYGAAAAGIGSAMADAISGYGIYIPATLIIKSLMAFASYEIYHKLSEKGSFTARVTAACTAEIIMILGYAAFEAVLYSSAAAALLGMSSNLVQGIMGAASSVVIYETVLKRIPQFHSR